jgi:hypothetical protein
MYTSLALMIYMYTHSNFAIKCIRMHTVTNFFKDFFLFLYAFFYMSFSCKRFFNYLILFRF